MLSALLRSGDVKNYTALGQDGTPVYAVASQLREAIKFRVKDADNKNIGKTFANYLAIPQRNDQGSQIDWYVPFESERPDGKYMIIPWTAATDEERAAAFAELSQFEQAMLQFGLKLKNTDNLQGDLLLFSRLLCGNNNPSDISDPDNLKALRFPSPEYVYLVNNKPVITFWGFVEKNTELYGNPFLSLKPVVREPTPIVTDVVEPTPIIEEKKPWWRWLLWLLPLLLLGLLALFFLRGCWAPKVEVAATSSDTSKVKAPSVERRVCFEGISYRFLNGNWIADVNKKAVTEPHLIEKLNQLPTQLTDKCELVHYVDPNKKVVGADVNQTVLNSRSEVAKSSDVVESNQPESADKAVLPELDSTNDKLNQVDNNKDSVEKTALEPQTLPEKAPTDDLATRDLLQKTQSEHQTTNQPLQIPAESAKSGNVDFLNGQWNAGAGIQDKSTGKPLRLKYEFEKGKGQVRVERGDGIQCVGDVNAAMQGGSLNIGNTGIAKCSDGSTYQLPNVKCKPDASGSADCEGEYGRGQRFPMSMKTN
ncbi:SrfA family protein [Pasteurella canis]|uniref:SrfA family protein n=1 Tax=Pasteurella canis TaxID=753 RepID=UPI0013273C68|nr:SrfA family protein [Pasteurella canis]MXN88967.1 virulence factor [Pasteurella canis]